MGHRCTFVTQHISFDWPAWFRERWNETAHIPEGSGALASRREAKAYHTWQDLPADIQRAFTDWKRLCGQPISIVWLHETGDISYTLVREFGIQHYDVWPARRDAGITEFVRVHEPATEPHWLVEFLAEVAQ